MKTDERIAELARELADGADPRDRVIAGILMWAAGIYLEGGHAHSLAFVTAAKETDHAN